MLGSVWTTVGVYALPFGYPCWALGFGEAEEESSF